jgi:hypothetical protein
MYSMSFKKMCKSYRPNRKGAPKLVSVTARELDCKSCAYFSSRNCGSNVEAPQAV